METKSIWLCWNGPDVLRPRWDHRVDVVRATATRVTVRNKYGAEETYNRRTGLPIGATRTRGIGFSGFVIATPYLQE